MGSAKVMESSQEIQCRIVVAALVDEHHRILSTIDNLLDGGSATPASRLRLAKRTCAMLTRHFSAEQRYLYPSIRLARPDGDRVVELELVQDRDLLEHARRLPSYVDQPARFGKLLSELDTLVRQHIHTCSLELFPPVVATTANAGGDMLVGRGTYPPPPD